MYEHWQNAGVTTIVHGTQLMNCNWNSSWMETLRKDKQARCKYNTVDKGY